MATCCPVDSCTREAIMEDESLENENKALEIVDPCTTEQSQSTKDNISKSQDTSKIPKPTTPKSSTPEEPQKKLETVKVATPKSTDPMAQNRPKKSLTPSKLDGLSPEALRENCSRLLADIDTERKLVKTLRREKSYEVQQIRDLEQTKSMVALKDLRTKLHHERSKDLESQKEALNRKFDLDLQMVTRQKEAELAKLRTDLQKCQGELQETREQIKCNKHGLSGTSARSAFDSERGRLLRENETLKSVRGRLEAQVKTLMEAEREKAAELCHVQDEARADVARARKDADVEIRRLLEELRSKERAAWQVEREQGARASCSGATLLLMETPPIATTTLLPPAGRDANCRQMDDSVGVQREKEYIATAIASPQDDEDPGGSTKRQMAELTARIAELQKQCGSLNQEKITLQQKLKEAEKKQKSTLEKNRQFLEKNIEVTNLNRGFEDKLKQLNEEINKLRKPKSPQRDIQKTDAVGTCKAGEPGAVELELSELRQQTADQEKDLAILRIACQEKDRRIDLLVHKRRKQRNKALKSVRFLLPAKCPINTPGIGGVKETYFGYDEDTLSLDSEMSSASAASRVSSPLSVDAASQDDSDDVFEEVSRSELEQNFQRLTRDHLQLERLCAVLQAKVGSGTGAGHGDSQEPGWLDERETLTKTIRMLKDKIKSQEQHEARVAFRIQEAQEQNEELEFRILELEELSDKLKEDAKNTITIKETPVLTDGGVLQMFAEEKGLMEIKLEVLKEKLHELKYAKDGQLEKSDKLVLLQARAMLGIADKKLKDLTSSQTVLKERVKTLEAEKAELLSAATGVSPDLVLEHEETRHKLSEAEQKVSELEELVNNYKKSEIVHKFTEDRNSEIEARQKAEILTLQRKLRNSTEGIEYERELFEDQLERIKELERDGVELQGRVANLCQNISDLEIENTQLVQEKAALTQRLSRFRETHDLAESDTEPNTRLHTLQKQLAMAESQATELINKTTSMEAEITSLKLKLDESEQIESEMTERNIQLEDRCCHLEKEMGTIAELRSHLVARDETITSLEKEVVSLRDGQAKYRDEAEALTENKQTIDSLQQEVNRLQKLVDEHQKRSEQLSVELRTLTASKESISADLEASRKAQKEAENEVSQVTAQNRSLLEKVHSLEARLREARENDVQTRDRLSLMEGEKVRRIEALQEQVDKMEENELRLTETITEMEEVESALRDQLESLADTGDSPLHTGESTGSGSGRRGDAEQGLLDQIEQMEVNERVLRDRIAELESGGLQDVDRSPEHVANLQTQVQELTNKEAELLEEVYAMKLENQELQEHLDELLEKQGSDQDEADTSLQESQAEIDSLKAQMDELERENSALKDQVLRAKLSAIETDELKTEEKVTVKALQDRLDDYEVSEKKLQKDLMEKENANKYLKEKVETLTEAERRLMDQIEFLEESQEKLNTEMRKLREAASTGDELKSLQEKVSVLLGTEEKLVDRLQEQEKLEQRLQKKCETEAKKTAEVMQQLEIYKAKCEKLNEVDNSQKNVERIKKFEETEKIHKVRINELEKSEAVLRTKISGLEESILQKEQMENELREQVTAKKESESLLRDRMVELEKSDVALRAKLSSLESQKQDLLNTIRQSAQKSQNVTNGAADDKTKANETSAKTTNGTSDAAKVKMETVISPTDIEELSRMSREAMISRIHELEHMEQFHMVKIRELSDNLSTFRQAVEVVAVTMETDADIPLLSYKPKLRDTEIESRVQELLKAEVTLKLQNLQLEKHAAVLKCQLREAESTLKQQTREYRRELEAVESELDVTRKNEARLKNKLQYGGWGQETQSLAKIQHLENLVFDLETSERKLSRQLQESQDSERDMREKLARLEQLVTQTPPFETLKSAAKDDEFYKLLAKIKLAETSERDRDVELRDFAVKNEESSGLQERIAELERSELGLRRKLSVLEAQEASMNFEEEETPMVLDSPEAILRQRIRELERMERHLKQQVVELERDREELHEIARRDKTTIHELSVRLRELQLSDSAFRAQVAQLETSETELHAKLDDATDKVDELEAANKKCASGEKHLKAQIQKHEYQESLLKAQVEHAQEDIGKLENRLKRRSTEMESERETLVAKRDEMFNRVGDLEGSEISLKQKLRMLESSESKLKARVEELESAERSAKTRCDELEVINENLSQKIHTLSEEKSSLVFEMSDMEMLRSENNEDVQKLNGKVKSLLETVRDLETKKSTLQRQLDASTDKEVKLQSRLTELERREKESKEKIGQLNQENTTLNTTVEELQRKKLITENKEVEFAEQKKQTSNKMTQAHELLKRNHEDLKAEMKKLQQQIASGDIKLKDKTKTSSKSVQVRLVDTYTIRHLAPEFKNALRALGARHPEAYQEFVRALQPPDSGNLSLVRVSGDKSSPSQSHPPGIEHPHTSTPRKLGHAGRMSDSGINEDFVLALTRDGDEDEAKASEKPEVDDSTKKALIGQLVDALSAGEGQGQSPEAPLWQLVEDKDPKLKEKPYWTEVEEQNGARDDMTLTVDVWGLTTTDESGSEAGHPTAPAASPLHNRSSSSMASLESDAPPPPLPASAPPPPPMAVTDGDSADEASDIDEDEDDGATPLRFPGLRAKSLERDSDFSEGSYNPSFGSTRPNRRGKQWKVVGSLDSIPDSGTGSYRQDDLVAVLKEKIASLEAKLEENNKKDEVAALKSQDILASNPHPTLLSNNKELSLLRAELGNKTLDLESKSHKIENLTEELEQLKARSRTELEKVARTPDLDNVYSELQQSNRNLKVENEALKCQISSLDEKTVQITTLEKTIVELTTQLDDLDRLQLERKDLDTKLRALEDALRKKAQMESELTRENAKIRREIDTLKLENKQYLVMERDYGIVRSKYSQMEQIKSKALTMITPLRAKVLRLAGMCKSKDELINRLATELRKMGENSDAVRDAEKIATHTGSEEYSRPISPITAQTLQVFETDLRAMDIGHLSLVPVTPQRSASNLRRRHSSSDESTTTGDSSDPEVPKSPRERYRRSRSSDDLDDLTSSRTKTIDDFVVAPPQLSLKPVTQLRENGVAEASTSRVGMAKEMNGTQRPAGRGECQLYRAVKKYDPRYFSTSGHQRLELALNEGDLVKILSERDRKGYYEGEVNGRVGLVPALYLQPVQSNALRNTQSNNRTKQNQPSHVDSSPEQILSFYQQLEQSHVPNHTVPDTSRPTSPRATAIPRTLTPTGGSTLTHPAYHKAARPSPTPRSPRDAPIHPAYRHGYQSQPITNGGGGSGLQNFRPPEPPTDFCIQRVVGDHSLLLSWTPPVLDELARSNGIVVKGYKIYINGKDRQTVPSPHMSKALVERLDLRPSLTLSIQTASESGLLSRLVEAMYDGSQLDRSRGSGDTGREGDLSLLSSSQSEASGDRKVFLAIYDYSPSQQSPSMESSRELSFKTGDIIVTTGNVREDGFYYSKVHGKKGLVPASFVEEIAILRSGGRRSVCSNSSLGSNYFSPASSVTGGSLASTATLDRSRPVSSQSGRSSAASYQSGKAPLATV